MLQYKCRAVPDGLRVTFAQQASWVSPIAASILVIALRYFGLSIGRLDDNSKGFFVGVGLYLAGVGSVLIVMAASFTLANDLRRYRCLFSPTGISLTVSYVGIPFRTLTFDREEIHKFGWSRRPHASQGLFRFSASGQRYDLAINVSQHDVDEFIEFLARNSISYSSEEEPLQRRTSANTLLG